MVQQFTITVSKPTARPGEFTTVSTTSAAATLQQSIAGVTQSIDWRVQQVNARVLQNTHANIKRLGLRIKGFS